MRLWLPAGGNAATDGAASGPLPSSESLPAHSLERPAPCLGLQGSERCTQKQLESGREAEVRGTLN